MDGLRRSPGFASDDAVSVKLSNIRVLTDGLPRVYPVTICDFLAYSCAAARELHPLPCLCHRAKTRKPKDISKNGKSWCEEFTGREWWKSTLARLLLGPATHCRSHPRPKKDEHQHCRHVIPRYREMLRDSADDNCGRRQHPNSPLGRSRVPPSRLR